MEQENNILILEEYTEQEIKNQKSVLPMMWRVLLFSDGSMTRNIQNISNQAASIQVIQENSYQMKDFQEKQNQNTYLFNWQDEFKIQNIQEIIEREVFIGIKNQEKNEFITLVKARSIWNKVNYEKQMNKKDTAIGLNLIANRTEYFRENKKVCKFNKLYKNDPFFTNINGQYSRGYFMYNQGEIMCYIEEFFSENLENLIIQQQ